MIHAFSNQLLFQIEDVCILFTRLLEAMGNFIMMLRVPGGHGDITYFREQFITVISEQTWTPKLLRGLTFSTSIRVNFTQGKVWMTSGNVPDNSTKAMASLTLPGSLLTDQDAGSDVRLGFVVYGNQALFQPRPGSDPAKQFVGLEVGGPVISVFVSGVSDSDLLEEPVSLIFQKTVRLSLIAANSERGITSLQ